MANALGHDCPLTAKDYADINRALETLNRHRLKCEKAKAAGEDVEGDIAINEAYREQFARYKKEYFPGKP
jgi:hypothetical protein